VLVLPSISSKSLKFRSVLFWILIAPTRLCSGPASRNVRLSRSPWLPDYARRGETDRLRRIRDDPDLTTTIKEKALDTAGVVRGSVLISLIVRNMLLVKYGNTSTPAGLGLVFPIAYAVRSSDTEESSNEQEH
jgi:hypothetical protein